MSFSSYALPPALRPGDAVAVVAPSGPFERPVFERGLARLASRYRPVLRDDLGASARYLAGDDARRLAELQAALDDPSTRAVFCARGGYGAMRLLPRLTLRTPKLLVGFSDITALHCALQARGVASVHAPVVTQLGSQPEDVVEELFRTLEDPRHRVTLAGAPVVAGAAEGPVLGGNLSVLTRLLGTPYLPDFSGALLFFEDVGERPYRLDRMWTHLALAGVLDDVAGVAMGTFSGCAEKDADYSAEDVLTELARARGLPCVVGLPVGHGEVNRPLPLGARARLDGAAGTLSFLEGAVR